MDIGRLRGDTSNTITIMVPLLTPAPPTPAIAQPTTTREILKSHAIIPPNRYFSQAVDVCAAPHIALPTSNKTIATKNVRFISYNLYSFPYNGLEAAHVSMYALTG